MTLLTQEVTRKILKSLRVRLGEDTGYELQYSIPEIQVEDGKEHKRIRAALIDIEDVENSYLFVTPDADASSVNVLKACIFSEYSQPLLNTKDDSGLFQIAGVKFYGQVVKLFIPDSPLKNGCDYFTTKNINPVMRRKSPYEKEMMNIKLDEALAMIQKVDMGNIKPLLAPMFMSFFTDDFIGFTEPYQGMYHVLYQNGNNTEDKTPTSTQNFQFDMRSRFYLGIADLGEDVKRDLVNNQVIETPIRRYEYRCLLADKKLESWTREVLQVLRLHDITLRSTEIDYTPGKFVHDSRVRSESSLQKMEHHWCPWALEAWIKNNKGIK